MSENGEVKGHKPHSLEAVDEFFGDKRQFIRHYTCNSPPEKELSRFGILAQGGMFGCKDNTEVVMIPTKLVMDLTGKKELPEDPKDFGLECEIALRKLQERNQKK